jgi:hypothetical protein
MFFFSYKILKESFLESMVGSPAGPIRANWASSPSAHAHGDLLPGTQSHIAPPASPPESISLLFTCLSSSHPHFRLHLPRAPSAMTAAQPSYLPLVVLLPRSNQPRLPHAQACTSRSVTRARASRDLGLAYLICSCIFGRPRCPVFMTLIVRNRQVVFHRGQRP